MTEGTSERACDKCRERRVKVGNIYLAQPRVHRLLISSSSVIRGSLPVCAARNWVNHVPAITRNGNSLTKAIPCGRNIRLLLIHLRAVNRLPPSVIFLSIVAFSLISGQIPTQGKGEGISLTQSINATPLSITRSITGHPNESNVSSRAFEAPSSLPKSLTVFRSANNSPSVASDVLNDGSADIPLVVERPAQIQDLDTDTLLDELWQSATYDPEWFDLDPEEYYGNGNNSCGFIPNAQDIVSENYQTDLAMTTIPSASPFSAGFDTFSDRFVCNVICYHLCR